ncbi:phage major tail tube protein [Mesorhizobium sp. Cs1299R1N3]|uniref:phage major tail tube protein n=1 Tax=Mesorhizobium sp. Cs1299R1N3 TaxID=3015173 RepID=UPI00301DB45A
MPSELPRYILRNCTVFADRVNKIGQASEITIPVPARVTGEVRNAGMIKPRKVGLGFEGLEMSFKMTAFDPQTIKLFALNGEKDFMVTGALVDEDDTTHSAIVFMRGTLTKPDAGAWKPGDLSSTDYTVDVNYCKIEVDGETLIEIDDFEVIVGGKSQTGAIRAALLS